MEKWHRADEKLPEDNQAGFDFMCIVDSSTALYIPMPPESGLIALEYRVGLCRGRKVRRWYWRNRVCPWKVTHWMDRPEPPNE